MEVSIKTRQIQRDNNIKLRIFVKENRIKVYAFAIMSNYIHVIWQVQPYFQPKTFSFRL